MPANPNPSPNPSPSPSPSPNPNPSPHLFAQVFSAFTKKKVQQIKASGFNGSSFDDKSKSIRCSMKAIEGFLYPLDKCFFFISNKPVLIHYDKISNIEFNRVNQQVN